MTDIWHTFLIDQFHDVLPGTCIGLTYVDTRQNFKELSQRTEELAKKAITAIAGGLQIKRLVQVRPEMEDIILENDNEFALIANTLGYDRFDPVSLKVNDTKYEDVGYMPRFGFAAVDVKHLEHSASYGGVSLTVDDLSGDYEKIMLENRMQRIVFNKYGQIESWIDDRTGLLQRELVRKGDTINKLCIH